MRDAFIEELTVLAREDESIFLVIGDLGYGVIDEFAKEFPQRFLNSGITEQSMMSMAAGIAASGYKVFVYSIANFPTFRCLEQIRNDVAYHQQNVTIVSVGAGLGYGTLGYTHHAIEDISALRSIPGMKVLSPSDPKQTKLLTRLATQLDGPKYLRLGKNGELNVGPDSINPAPYWRMLNEGNSDLIILSTGAIIEEVVNTLPTLSDNKVQPTICSVEVIKPFPEDLIQLIGNFSNVISIEEHTVVGGFGSAVLEQLSIHQLRPRTKIIGLSELTVGQFNGSQTYLRSVNGLTAEKLSNDILAFMK